MKYSTKAVVEIQVIEDSKEVLTQERIEEAHEEWTNYIIENLCLDEIEGTYDIKLKTVRTE